MLYNLTNIKNVFKIWITFNSVIQENSEKVIPAWNVPVLNPFHKDALEVLITPIKEECLIKKLSKLHGNSLIVDDVDGDIKSVHVEYIIRGRRKKADGILNPPKMMNETGIIMDKLYSYNVVENDDFHVHFSKPIPVKRNSAKKQFVLNSLKQDFFRVTIMKRYEDDTIKEYHYRISNKQKVCGTHGRKLNELKKGLKYNINMVMLDAQSRGNMYRQTRRLMSVLENDENTLLFKAHGIHGDGTTCQLMAILEGMLKHCFSVRNYAFC